MHILKTSSEKSNKESVFTFLKLTKNIKTAEASHIYAKVCKLPDIYWKNGVALNIHILVSDVSTTPSPPNGLTFVSQRKLN